ncbi:MAG: branched-chain amino acid ABC transporter permease [Chloroflexi bacterium]|nr:branched-chain amino acid ABC transporter permease [Chloroflexota bacterium]MBU1877750.1 branched-chain amino acid ABC transporter permease [Chloroflexota bacterium]
MTHDGGRNMPIEDLLARIINITLQGLTMGMLFFLIASGLSLIFGLMDVLNFAHGSLFMIGSYVALTTFWLLGGYPLESIQAQQLGVLGFNTAPVLIADSNLRFLIAVITGTTAGLVVGTLMEWGLIRPLYKRPIFQILLTLGMVYVLAEIVKLIWGPAPLGMAKPELLTGTVDILGRAFPIYNIFIILLGFVVMAVVYTILRRSRIGIIIRAGVEDSEMVQALGINVRRVFTGVFALGAGLAALGGAAAVPFLGGANPDQGMAFQLSAFVVVVIGGMGSFPGAFVGALLVGLARSFADYQLSPIIAQGIVVGMMALVLLIRPQGLFGRKQEGGH